MLLPVISGFVNAPIGAAALATITGFGAGVAAALANAVDGAGGIASVSFVNAAVIGLLDFKGSQDCSANPNYPSASKGDVYIVSVAGKIGGASGSTVEAGDLFTATADNAGGSQASVGTSWVVTQANVVLGTGVATAMAIAVGSTGAIVTNGGALGTPSSGILTNATGYTIENLTGSTMTFTGASAMTGGAGNMTITSGTGNSRTLILRTTTSGGTATTALTLDAAQGATVAGTTAITGANTGALQVAGGVFAGNFVYSGTGIVAGLWNTSDAGGSLITAINGNNLPSLRIIRSGVGKADFTFFSSGPKRLDIIDTDNSVTPLSLNMAGTGAVTVGGMVLLVGATSSFPALKRSATIIQSRLADDSGFASLQGKITTDAAATTGLTAGVLSALTNASITITDSTGQVYRVPVII